MGLALKILTPIFAFCIGTCASQSQSLKSEAANIGNSAETRNNAPAETSNKAADPLQKSFFSGEGVPYIKDNNLKCRLLNGFPSSALLINNGKSLVYIAEGSYLNDPMAEELSLHFWESIKHAKYSNCTNDKPDVFFFKTGADVVFIEDEKHVEIKIGELYRKERDSLVKGYVEMCKKELMSRKNLFKHTMADGFRLVTGSLIFEAYQVGKNTHSFYVYPKYGNDFIIYIRDTKSDSVKSLIEDLVEDAKGIVKEGKARTIDETLKSIEHQ